MAAKRSGERENFPKGLYEPRPGYFVYRSPVSHRTMTLGAVQKKEAFEYAKEANRQATLAQRHELAERVSRPHDEVDERGLLQADFISRRAMVFDSIVGVYFLLKDDAIVYVGKSTNILYRIATHRYQGVKVFNRVFVLECPAGHLDRLERLYIDKFKPIHNIDVRFVEETEAVWSENIRSLLGLAIHQTK